MAPSTKIALALVATAALVAPAASAQLVTEGGRKLTATMTGAAEVNAQGVRNQGDPDGAGTARFVVNPGQRRICYELAVSNIDPAAAAHIHIAPPTRPGPIVVHLTAPTNGTSSGCVDVSRELALAILKRPQDYYVNVHNTPYPNGAVRGQLAK